MALTSTTLASGRFELELDDAQGRLDGPNLTARQDGTFRILLAEGHPAVPARVRPAG